MNIVDQWKKLSHANLVTLRQVFTTKSFADHSMVFVYDLYAGAETLMSKHFNSPSQVRLSSYTVWRLQLGCTVAAVSAQQLVEHVKNDLQNIRTDCPPHCVHVFQWFVENVSH